jgi:hypothetical protein
MPGLPRKRRGILFGVRRERLEARVLFRLQRTRQHGQPALWALRYDGAGSRGLPIPHALPFVQRFRHL